MNEMDFSQQEEQEREERLRQAVHEAAELVLRKNPKHNGFYLMWDLERHVAEVVREKDSDHEIHGQAVHLLRIYTFKRLYLDN